MKRNNLKIKTSTIILALAIFYHVNVQADDLARQERITERQQQNILTKVHVLKYSDKSKRNIDLPNEKICFYISEIDLEGKHAKKFSWLLNYAKDYMHECVGIKGLNQLVNILNAKLFEDGFVTTSVQLPEQDLKSKTLKLQLFVGRVGVIKKAIVKNGKLETDKSNWGIWQNALPLRSGDILNLRPMEQAVENMKRLTSQYSTTTKIEPSEKQNTSDVYLLQEPIRLVDRLQAGFTVDNSGRGSLGKPQFAGYAGLDNLFGLNDNISFNLNSNIEKGDFHDESLGHGVSYSIPYNYFLYSYSFSYNQVLNYQAIVDDYIEFKTKSYTNNHMVSYLLWRTMSQKISIYSSIKLRNSKRFTGNERDQLGNRDTTDFIGGFNYRVNFLASILNVDIGFLQGIGIFGAKLYGKPSKEERPSILNYSTSFNINFLSRFQYIANFTGQHILFDSGNSIYYLEVGGRNSVRGYSEDETLTAGSGFYFKQEVQSNWFVTSNLILSPYITIDFGHVYGRDANTLYEDKWLLGTSIGTTLKYRYLHTNIALGRNLIKTKGFSGGLVFYLSLSFNA